LEIGAEETWNKDVDEKPMQYMLVGVEEYFAYDPSEPPLRRDGRRLFGWRLDRATGTIHELPLDSQGRLWRLHLESLLVPDDHYLRLYDGNGNGQFCLTPAEAEKRRNKALAEKLRSLGIDPDQI